MLIESVTYVTDFFIYLYYNFYENKICGGYYEIYR